jgi:hypothetical protein
MMALIVFSGFAGFACVPPGQTPVALPYAGPFAMGVMDAKRLLHDPRLSIVLDTDPGYETILARCPTVY